MSRARATALALVNWKGVFYERYALDRHVTALEGANGAGKTTVMIAAYVVLLPDLARLRFTNLGETGATGGDKGIWGRLGELDRPSYAALELELPGGEPLVAGVQLLRKGEPVLELTPFVIRGAGGAAFGGRLREILLVAEGEDDLVPELADVRAGVARHGGTLEVYSTIRDYFAALFDAGVMPLRMATDEDRKKYSEMLRTSMTGGISRALTSDLRGFLLQEQTGLGDALSQMRGNLDACHRTRIEVAEARRLEHEITGVYDAGSSAFAAAMLATRADAEERSRRVAEAREAHGVASRELRALDEASHAAEARLEAYGPRVTEARAAYAVAMARSEQMAHGVALAKRIAEVERDLGKAVAADDVAQRARRAADERRDAARLRRDRAREAYDRAATGLADMQSGLEELHRNAHAYRHVSRQLELAREALGEPALEEADFDRRLDALHIELAAIDARRADIERDVESAAARRDDFARAYVALEAVAGPTEPAQAYDEARRVLARLAAYDLQQTRVPELAAEAERSRQLGTRQTAVRARATAVGIDAGDGPAPLAVQRRLGEAEGELRAAEDEARAHDQAAAEARRAITDARRRLAELDATSARWREASATATRLEAAVGHPVRSLETLAQARTRLADERDAARRVLAERKQERDDLLREATRLESAAVAFHPELLQLRDELDGELLAARFEDLELTEAAQVQARLGPLADAIVVADPEEAARLLAGRPRELSSVWLVESGIPLGDDASSGARRVKGGAGGDDLVVREAHGVRIARVPPEPTLGRRARERRASALRAQAAGLDAVIEKALDAWRSAEALWREGERLVAESALLESGDPGGPMAKAQGEIVAGERAERGGVEAGAAARARAAAVRPRIDTLRGLLADAFLLDAPDQAGHAGAVQTALREALEARVELDRVAAPRRILAELVDALRTPPDAEGLAVRQIQRTLLGADRERIFRASQALSEVAAERQALRFVDAERALTERSAVVPALETQLAVAREAGRAEDALLREAELAWEAATAAAQETSAQRQAIEAHVARARGELDPETLQAASEAALVAAREAAAASDVERAGLERDERALATELALLRDRRQGAERAATAARARVAEEEALATPAIDAWTRAQRAAEDAGVVRGLLATRLAEGATTGTRPGSWPEARSRAEVLLDRLASARGGAECTPLVEAAVGAPESGANETHGGASETHLAAWLGVRDWVKRRLPAQVADAPDPLDALERLQGDLGLLEERLVSQELDLRGASEDIARGLDVQLRKATHTLRRLNHSLEGVAFGSIAGIRVQMRRVERMDQVLRALREGAAQELLFQSTLPIDEALDEIFRRFGGGKTGGQRILDYREYVELGVEIRRRAGEQWEAALPTRLSTGEAIGVGAALMMVILTEWERDANLLRGKRASGSLRFLFLDEANRLSQDNLGVLFDLCKNLDLQLLIAAPEVARSEGNTTYRLVRRVAGDGREEVIVSGRRTIVTSQA